MNTHADKTPENKSQAVAISLAKLQNNGESTFQFADNRSDAIAQQKLQEALNISPQVQQLKAYQEMANNGSQVRQLRNYQAMADNFISQTAQRKETIEKEILQGKFEPTQKKENNTGLPDNLKSGIENLSGYSLDDVKVHYNSDKPTQLQAHAYAQGTDIHLASGQDKHLPHEAWHVVQQKQGRVKPTMQMKGGVNVNDDVGLEKEADVMSTKASQFADHQPEAVTQRKPNQNVPFVQLKAAESTPGEKMGLDELLNQLDATLMQVNKLAEESNEDQDFSYLSNYIKKLHAITNESDSAAKSVLLKELKEELNEAGEQGAMTRAEPVQRVGVLGGILIGAGIAGLGLAIHRAYTYLRDRREDRVLADYYATGVVAHPGIPAELIAGIPGLANNALKAARLFQNINNFRFRYTGNFVNPAVAYSARQGDCQTLVGLYQNVAVAQGIPFAVGNLNQRQLVAPGAIHGRNTTANTEGNTDWYFHEHYWAIGAGTLYDVLFMVSPPPASIVTNGNAVHNGVTYYTFADGRCVIEPGQAALRYNIQGEGRVFANAAVAIAFINAHP